MEQSRRELLVARVLSGTLRLRLSTGHYVYRYPGREVAYRAQLAFARALERAREAGMLSEDGALSLLMENGLWAEHDSVALANLPKEMDELKLKLFRSGFKSNERATIRKALAAARTALAGLQVRRSAFEHFTDTWAATCARDRLLVAKGLTRVGGARPGRRAVDEALHSLPRERISDAENRELARTEPWRSLWACRKAGGGLFGPDLGSLTEEQRVLTTYSCFYDSVWEHPDCPDDSVVTDDDMLDGWLIDQRRQREDRHAKRQGEKLLGNDKIRNADEVFIVAETFEDAKRAHALNDQGAKAIHAARMNVLKKKGTVSEMEMPDTKQRLRMEVTRKLSEAARGGGG